MTKTEQAYLDYVKENLLPILKEYISDEVNSLTIEEIENNLSDALYRIMRNKDRQKAIQHLVKFKIDKPKVFKEIMESKNPAESYLYVVGVLPLAGLGYEECNEMLLEANDAD